MDERETYYYEKGCTLQGCIVIHREKFKFRRIHEYPRRSMYACKDLINKERLGEIPTDKIPTEIQDGRSRRSDMYIVKNLKDSNISKSTYFRLQSFLVSTKCHTHERARARACILLVAFRPGKILHLPYMTPWREPGAFSSQIASGQGGSLKFTAFPFVVSSSTCLKRFTGFCFGCPRPSPRFPAPSSYFSLRGSLRPFFLFLFLSGSGPRVNEIKTPR